MGILGGNADWRGDENMRGGVGGGTEGVQPRRANGVRVSGGHQARRKEKKTVATKPLQEGRAERWMKAGWDKVRIGLGGMMRGAK